MTIYNLGSINLDMTLQVPHLPGPGETLAVLGSETGLGGKGANQSVAAARAGRTVRHIGQVGPDGDEALALLAGYGVDLAHVGRVAAPTGRAIIAVDGAGENSILILPGANRAQSDGAIAAALAAAGPGDTLLLQNETNGQQAAAQAAKARGLRVIYSAAPFEPDAVTALLPHLDLLLMNQVEAAQLAERVGQSPGDLPVPHLVVTKGAAGARLYDRAAGTARDFPSLAVTPLDTTGAGDTFAGYLAAGLDEGFEWDQAMARALAAGALATTRLGTAQAIPSRAEVEARL